MSDGMKFTQFSWKTRSRFFCFANNMAADALATQVAMVSRVIVLI